MRIFILIFFLNLVICEESTEIDFSIFSSKIQYMMKTYNKDQDKLKTNYMKEVKKSNDNFVKKLEVELAYSLKKGDLEESLEIKKLIDNINNNSPKTDFLGNIVTQQDEIKEREANKLAILSARYGTDNNSVDVLEIVNKFTQDNNCRLSVRNHILECDPAPGQRKKLFVKYKLNGKEKTVEVTEGMILDIQEKEKIDNQK